MDSTTVNREISTKQFNTGLENRQMCRLLRYLPANTLVNLQRNQSCNCLVYFLYRNKEYPLFTRWEFKVPFCYRSQIKLSENGVKLFDAIKKREIDCKLASLKSFCFPPPTTTTFSTSTTSSTTTTTTSTRPRTARPTAQAPTTKATKFPKLNLVKLIKVVAVIIIVSLFSILLTIAGLKLSNKLEKRKKALKLQNTRQRTSSNSSSNQATLINNISVVPNANSKSKIATRLVMPPSVMPPFTRNLPNLNPKKKQSTINQLVSQTSGAAFTGLGRMAYRNNTNESSALLNNINPKTASFSIGSSANE